MVSKVSSLIGAVALSACVFAALPTADAQTGHVRHRHRRSTVVPAVRYDAPTTVGALDTDLSSMLHGRVHSGQWGVIVVMHWTTSIFP